MDDITSLVDIKDSFKILKGTAAPYNGSMWLMDTGSRKQVYDHFHPINSPAIAGAQMTTQGKRFYGSDQAWISYKIPGEKTWSGQDGIYQYVYDIKDKPFPKNAKIIFFAGDLKPWSDINFVALHNVYKKYE